MKVISLALSFLLGLTLTGCQAQAVVQADSLCGAGDLLAKGDKPLPLKHTDVKINVTGLVASVQVEQTFTNPYQERIEAVYIFPLPSEAAVDDMVMKIGDRTIRSLVKRREEAKQIYEQAKQTGQQAGLLEQERPNIFTTSVANIAPGDEVRIQIHYTQLLPYDDGGFRLRFPMVVGPRYIPGKPAGKQGPGSVPDTRQVPDASRITPPVLRPEKRPGYNISLSVDIDAGLPIQHIKSGSHQISMSDLGPGRYHITLARKDEMPNKDFVLDYKLAGPRTQAVALTSRGADGTGYFMLMAVPPGDYLIGDIYAKEAIFVIDTSGSMSGPKIVQAKNALRAFVHGLNPQDAFNIIRFSSDFSYFSPKSVPFIEENLQRADAYIDQLQANGGTEMLPALMHALKQPRDEGRLPVIVFLTDAQVGNENEILKAIQQHLGDARLYTFGVDTAPNDYLLRKMAELGRGTVEYVLPSQNLEEVIARFQNRIASPVMADVRIDWKGWIVDGVYPSPIPDLFLAKPVVLYGRVMRPGNHTINLRGMSAGGMVTIPVQVDFKRATADQATLAALWARARIDALSDLLHTNPGDDAAKEEIANLAMTYKLMSQFTSFVAVEERIVASPDGGPPKTVVVPVPLPESWDYDAVFGKRGQRPFPGRHYIVGSGPAMTATLRQAGSVPQSGASGGIVGGVPGTTGRDTAKLPASTPPPYNSAGESVADAVSISLATDEERLQAVARYLMREQRVNGLWTDRQTNRVTADDLQTTALALLGYLAGEHTDRAGHYQAQVRRALGQLTSSIDADGQLKGLQGQDSQVQTQALALWAMAESFAATGSSHYKAAAEKLLAGLLQLRAPNGLWPARAGEQPDITATAWAALALRSAQKAGLSVDQKMLEAVARAATAPASASPVEQALIEWAAGQSLSKTRQAQLTTILNSRSLTLNTPERLTTATLDLLAARLLGDQARAQIERKALQALTAKQQTQGKLAGGFALDAGHPVAASARAYLLLNIGHAQWAVFR
jgi:Ca-activated chloride channel family protein